MCPHLIYIERVLLHKERVISIKDSGSTSLKTDNFLELAMTQLLHAHVLANEHTQSMGSLAKRKS